MKGPFPAFIIPRFLLASWAVSTMALAGEPSPIPLETGNRWVYEANVKWTPASGSGQSGIQSRSWRWTMEVLETVSGPSGRAAVVQGCPDEIAGMDPEVPKGFCVFIEASNRVYKAHAQSRREAVGVARRFAEPAPAWPARTEVFLDLPLTVDKRWGDENADTRRADGWYCWHVEGIRKESVRVKGVTLTQPVAIATVAYRTGPDRQLLDVASGVGIVRFEYEHHGTVAASEVRLVEFIPGAKAKSPGAKRQ